MCGDDCAFPLYRLHRLADDPAVRMVLEAFPAEAAAAGCRECASGVPELGLCLCPVPPEECPARAVLARSVEFAVRAHLTSLPPPRACRRCGDRIHRGSKSGLCWWCSGSADTAAMRVRGRW